MFQPSLSSRCKVDSGALADGISLWIFSDGSPDGLSDAERERAGKFLSPEARSAYVAGRAGLRVALGSYLHCSPSELVIKADENGKPYVDGPVHFNISHSGDLVVGAFSFAPVGIDVERVAREVDIRGIASRYFTPGEAARIAAAGDGGRELFFKLWTAKEAMLKLSGAGLANGLSQAVVEENGECFLDARRVFVRFFEREGYEGAVASFEEFEVKGWFGS